MTASNAKNCPICNKDNKCGNVLGNPNGTCWCSKEYFTEEILAKIPQDQLRKACVCKECIERGKGAFININMDGNPYRLLINF